jgi:hypothetical protein
MTPPSAEGAAAFFEDCMDRIRSSRPVVLDFSTCVLDVDGELIRLEFSSAELEAKMSRALAHLRVLPAGPEGLCLHIWDAAVSCVPMPPSPWSGTSYRSQAGTFKAEEGRVVYQDDRFLMHFYLSEHMLLLDFATNTGLVCYPDAGGLAGYDRAAPLRSAMQCWLDRRGKYLIHAAAVGFEEGAVVLVGAGGSGKSTTALLALGSGMAFAGDDYCLVTVDGEPRVVGLYGSAKLRWDNLHRVEGFFGPVEVPPPGVEEKAVLFVNEVFPGKMLRSAPIHTLLVLRVVAGGQTRAHPASAAEALRALAPTTVSQHVGPVGRSFAAMAALVRRVPALHLELGEDTEKIAPILREVLAH